MTWIELREALSRRGLTTVGAASRAAQPKGDVTGVAYDSRAHAWATIRVLVIPLVSWLWLGGLVVGVGAVIAALPQPKRRTAMERVAPLAVETSAK